MLIRFIQNLEKISDELSTVPCSKGQNSPFTNSNNEGETRPITST